MKRIYLILLLLGVLIFSWGVNAIHLTPDNISPAADLELLLEITQGGEELAAVDINFRIIGESIWQKEPMHKDTPVSPYWRGVIPGNAIANDEVEYRFELKQLSGNIEYIPARNSVLPNYFILPLSPEGSQSEGFVLLTDESSISADEGYVLAVSFLALLPDLDPGSIKVFVGGKDVTKRTQISESVLMYREDHPQDGITKAIVTASAKGKQIYSDTWITQVLPGTLRRELPFTYRGSANFSTNIYNVSGDNPTMRAAKNDFRTWADLYGSYGIVDLQTNLLISSLEDSNQQPVNRYTFGLQVPHFDLYVGDHSPNLSKYTLSGKNIRGVHGELYGRYAALSLTHGQSVRQTKFQTEDFKSGTFKQEAIAARLRLGSENGFMVAFNGSRHRDVISSLDEAYYRYTQIQGETVDTLYTTMAQDNLVLSMDARLNLPSQHVMMGVEVAGSLYNSNTIPGALTSAELEEYGMDPEFAGINLDPSNLSNLFVINKNMEPFLPSRTNLAWNAYLSMYLYHNFLNLEYSETGSAFYSLGTYAQPVDCRMISISDQVSFGRMLSVIGSYIYTQDNLMKHSSETNTYHNVNAQAILRLERMPYFKTSFYTNTGKNKENSEVADAGYAFSPFNRDSMNMSFGMGYDFIQIPYVPTQLDLSFRLGKDFSELNTEAELQPMTDNKNSGISLNLNSRYTLIPLRTQLSYVNSQNSNELLDKKYVSNSFFLKADYALWENKIMPYVSFRTTGLGKDYLAQNYNNYNLGVQSYPMQNMSVSADLGIKTYTNGDASDLDYNATTFRLSLTQRF